MSKKWFFLFRQLSVVLCSVLLFCGCYHQKKDHDALSATNPQTTVSGYDSAYMERVKDSLSFYTKHHYTENYNFVVKTDSIMLLRQQPEEAVSMMPTDTFSVYHHDPLVVADIRILPNDSIDSVWVQVARDQMTFGWIHESELLPKVVPDDPISQFISTFSDRHLLIFLVIITLIGFAYLMHIILKRNAKIVHFNDIHSVYPTLLAITIACAATLYASIQLFAPEMWRHFYYHPTLNPFSVPLILSIFLVTVWLLLIIAIACLDVVVHQLPLNEAVLYLCGLGAVCALNYIVFSVTTLYYIGYPLLFLYIYFALTKYRKHSHCLYICGHCGAMLTKKGRCPHCGTVNQ